ncbi:MAG: beta-lactamase family protein [Acidobacteriota bacterium]|nr:beta-lactamase family protein [Acidobacteriota bacterium]
MSHFRRHHPILVSFTLILTAFLLSSCGSAPQQQPGPTPTTIPGLQEEVQKILTRYHVPGAGIALVNKDQVIWAGGVGEARLSSHTPVTADTMFRVGSITKTFVALALLKLQEEKQIDLNAKLADIAPTLPFRNPWSATNPVTVADVLEHTAGFNDMLPSEVYNVFGKADMDPFQVSEQFKQTLVSRWPPGTRMSYSNPGYGVAGYLIWKGSHEQFGPYIEQNILQPLGMTVSDFTLTDKIYAQLAQGYDGNSPHPVPYLNIYLQSAGDLKSSPAELAKLVQMFLNGGKAGNQQIVSADSIARMEYPQTTLAAREGLKYGYGFANYATLDGPVVQHGHDGGISGFLSTYGYMPDQGVGYVALINSDSGGQALREIDQLLARYLLAGRTLPTPPTAAVPEEQFAPLVGYYERENPREQMMAFLDVLLGGLRVSLSNGHLYLKGWFGPAQELVPTGNNQFRTEKQAAASMIFITSPSGQEILATGGAGSFFGVRRGELWPFLRIVLVLLGLLAIASSLGFALWWIPRKLLGKMKGVGGLSLRLMPLLAGLSLLGAFLILKWTPIWVLGTYNMASVGVWLLSWLFAAFGVLGLIVAWPAHWQPGNRWVFRHSVIVSIACCCLAAYMAYWHLLGVMLWKP